MCFENNKKERVRQVLPKTKNDGITLTATPSLLQLPLKGRTHLEILHKSVLHLKIHTGVLRLVICKDIIFAGKDGI